MQRTDSTTSSTATSLDSDYDANEALRRVREIGPRPTPPKQRLHAEMNPKLRDLDWNGHMPSAPVRTVADWGSDDDKPVVPRIPGPRQPSDHYTPEQADLACTAAAIDGLWGTPWAHRAFGSAA